MEIKKSISMIMIMTLLIASMVYALVTPTTPVVDEYVNNIGAPNYLFSSESDNQFPGPVIFYYVNDVVGATALPCVGTTCSDTIDISTFMDGSTYTVKYQDVSGILQANGDIIIDNTNPIAADFGFSATDFVITYTADCTDTNIETETGQYSTDGFGVDINDFVSGADLTALGAGVVDFRGKCVDKASNEALTGTTQITLPANPPILDDVFDLPDEVTDVCGGDPSDNPCDIPQIDGGGAPIDIIYKLVFDKAAVITLTLDGGAPVGPSGSQTEHIIAIYSLMEGNHILTIQASDGVNVENYVINFDITNTGIVGNTIITVEPPLSPPPTTDITLVSSVQIGSNPYPGGTATINYTFVVTGNDETSYSFLTVDTGFDTPIVVTCDTNPAETMNIIAVFNGSFVGSVTCEGVGDELTTGLTYSVLVEYPITMTASGALSGTLGYGVR